MGKLVCTDVIRQAWNDEKSTFENDDLKIIVHLKNPELHGKISKGDLIDDLSFEKTSDDSSDAPAKSSSKRKSTSKKKTE